MVRATISADIISSTSLSVEELTLLQSEIHGFLDGLSEKSHGNDWGRLFKGDSVEIFLHDGSYTEAKPAVEDFGEENFCVGKRKQCSARIVQKVWHPIGDWYW